MAVFVFPPSIITSEPVKFNLDGVPTQVSKDTVTPSNSKALPVELTGASGPINITAGDLNVQLTDQGANPDVTRIGNGTYQLAITSANAAKVDGSAVTQPISAASLPLPSGAATEAKQDSEITKLTSIDGKLQANGVLDTGNTSTTLLGIGGNFTGTWVDITKYNSIIVGLKADVASATDGFKFEYSNDGVTVQHTHIYTYTAVDGIDYNFSSGFKYARVNYTNGAVAQTVFSVSTILKSSAVMPSSYRLAQTLSDQFSALITRGVIVGKSTAGGGTYVDVKVNPSGALAADVTGSVSVSNFPATQPVSGSVSVSNFPATQPVSGSVSVSNFPATQAISAASLPLPTGAATETTLSALNTKVPANLTVTSTRLLVDGSGVTQPVSGSVSVSNFPATQAVSGTVAVSNLASTLGQKTMANSAAVVIASDQSAISTTPAALVASFQEVLNLTTVAQVVTPPANAKWVKVYADNTNTNNIRIRFAGTATTTSGVSLEPGRDMDFNAMNTAISIIAEAGTNQKINFTFGA